MARVLAVLDTMWGDTEGNALPYFKINPKNHSGRRLYKLVDQNGTLWCTNACRKLVTHASKHGKPDPKWLLQNIIKFKPDLLLICGKIAQTTFEKSGFDEFEFEFDPKVIHLPHPAARAWTKKSIEKFTRKIRKALT